MPRYRIRYEEPESGGTLTSLVIGAVAGFAVGILVAQKSGGIAGITARVKDRWAELEESAEDEVESTNAEASHESDFGEELEEDDLEDEESLEDAGLDVDEDEAHAALEDDVLEAFQADSTLRERAIDISAVGDGLIELSGWVDTDDESHHAAAVARRVEGVESVVNRLAIGEADTAGPESDEHREHGAKRRRTADLDASPDEQE